MNDLELIGEILCRLDLPDRDVFSAMAYLRDYPLESAQRRLDEAFTACVSVGLDLPVGANHWQALADHPELRAHPQLQPALQSRAQPAVG